MAGQDINKIAGAILLAVLTAVAIGQLGNALFDDHEGLAEIALNIDLGEAQANVPEAVAAPGLDPIAPLLAAASVDNGQALSSRCVACHTFDKGGRARVGPNLYGVVGASRASKDDFSYSDALAASGAKWSYEDLNAFLAGPAKYAKGTKMNFAGLRKATDRADLIAYLRAQGDDPPPLPE